MFLPKKENLPKTPNGFMLDVVASRSTVMAYFLSGFRYMSAVRVSSSFSKYDLSTDDENVLRFLI